MSQLTRPGSLSPAAPRPAGHLALHDLSRAVIGAAIEVHRVLGVGLLESAYQRALAHELTLRGIPHESEVELPLAYKGTALDCGYRIDLCVAGALVVEVKAVGRVLPVHEAQLLTYMRLGGFRVGLLVNFHAPLLRAGVVRRVL